LPGERRDVGLLARLPVRLLLLEGVGAVLDHGGDRATEAIADLLEPLPAAVVLGGVVQERRDGLRLVAAEVEDGTGGPQQVGSVGDVLSLSPLLSVEPQRVAERVVESLSKPVLPFEYRHAPL
jgi:hypothetical protein